MNEALSRSLDSQGRTPPRLYDVARRGLLEELGLEGSEYLLELLAFDVDKRTSVMFRKGGSPRNSVESAPQPTPPSTAGRNAVGSAE